MSFSCAAFCVSHHHVRSLVFHPVIRAKVKEVKTKCHDVTAVVEVKEVLKSSLVNIPRDTVTLYTSSGCLCPPLSVSEEYVIMGYEDEERSRSAAACRSGSCPELLAAGPVRLLGDSRELSVGPLNCMCRLESVCVSLVRVPFAGEAGP